MSGLPPDWRARMIDMIRKEAELDGEWFTGGPVCSPLEQIEIYRTQYRLRLYEALLVETPGLSQLLGERKEELLLRFLYETPSRAWTLNRVADGLADWLARQGDVDPVHVEMARLDWAIQKGFESVDTDPIDPADLSSMPKLALQPHVHLLRLHHNTHEIRAAVMTGKPVPELVAGEYPIVVFRKGLNMRHWCVPLGLYGVLDALRRGLSIGEALDDVFVKGWVTPEELQEHIGAWFRDMAELKLVQIAPRAG